MIHALIQPFWLALFRGEADPPTPRSRRLRFPMPRAIGVLPFRTVDLPLIADVVLGVLVYAFTINALSAMPHQDNELLKQLTAMSLALPLLLRDRYPLAAWRVAVLAVPLAITQLAENTDVLPYTSPLTVMYLLVLYSVAVRCRREISLAVWIISVLIASMFHSDSMPVVAVVMAVAILFGYNVRVRRSATAQLFEEEKRSQVAKAAHAVLEERARIARELHDVVAHHMSVIAIQAEAVPLKAKGDVAQLEAGLAEIRGLSLEAIAELRQVLGVLRDEEGRKETTPMPGLERLDELVAHARSAGLAVQVERSGSVEDLPAAVGLSMYRIVQESLSNAMRHAPGATVAIEIARQGDIVQVRVANGPGTKAAQASQGAGQGLIGMRERAALLGGTLQAVPVRSGGFEVTARLPVGEDGA
ncbi:sensor histidine kinase [Nonomuraea sp. NPDC050556]|uniref:sensor histidine kinase n=1 Tax=Nonomuraea sp. NPDC050556 TaxID=3364369 RepID=UPI0037A6E68B